MTGLTPSTRELLRSARSDAPEAAARAQILEGIGRRTVGTAGVGAAAVKTGLWGGSAKMLVTGALLGSAITVGLAAVLLRVDVPKLHVELSYGVAADSEIASIAPVTRRQPSVLAPAAEPGERAASRFARESRSVHDSSARARVTMPHPHRGGEPEADPLAREAALVGEARSAIVRGEPDVALGALRATGTLSERAMEPEELSLEARALRAAGREPEAAFVEGQLRARFPDNALSR